MAIQYITIKDKFKEKKIKFSIIISYIVSYLIAKSFTVTDKKENSIGNLLNFYRDR